MESTHVKSAVDTQYLYVHKYMKYCGYIIYWCRNCVDIKLAKSTIMFNQI